MVGARCLTTVALALALALLAACGSSSSSSTQRTTPNPTTTFKRQYQPVVQQLKTISMDTATAIQRAPKQTDSQILVEFRGLANRWQRQLSRLDTVKPPAKLAADYNTLTTAATRVESDMRAIVPAAATHSAAAAKRASANLVSDILDTKSASTELDKRVRGA